MSQNLPIEWTGVTWNPVTGCDKVSEGCRNCYAERMAKRLKAMGQKKYRKGFKVAWHWDCLAEPLRWRKPRDVFVGSMGDLFHSSVPRQFVFAVFQVMLEARQHRFQVLTKRRSRFKELNGYGLWGRNVWMGVSVEDARCLERIEDLRECDAAVKFLSLEPLLGPLPGLDLSGIDWVIVGGESGPGARPMNPDWVRSIRDQCLAARVPFFFKQWGAWAPRAAFVDFESWDSARAHVLVSPGGMSGDVVKGRDLPDPELGLRCCDLDGNDGFAAMALVGKKRAGRLLDGRTWSEMPGTYLRSERV